MRDTAMMSMTGFCSLSTFIDSEQAIKIPFVGMLKSVNSRYFESHCKLPSLFQACEIDIINKLRAQLLRGKCSIVIVCSNPALLKEPVHPNIQGVQSYLQALEDIQQATGIQGVITIADIAKSHEFFASQEVSLSDMMISNLHALVSQLINGLIENRIKEGKVLREDILERTEIIKSTFEHIQQEAHRCFKVKENSIHQQLEQLSIGKETEVIRYHLTIESARSDLTEEIVRFKAHLESLTALTQDQCSKEKGKQLDFILQELGREINTIASKSTSTLLSSLVITIKVELEKIREQVQNIV